MMRNKSTSGPSYGLVGMHVIFLCLLQVEVTGSLRLLIGMSTCTLIGQILPMAPEYAYQAQPVMTSRPRSILQPVVNLVNNLLPGVLRPVVGGPGQSRGQRQGQGQTGKDWSYDEENEVEVGPRHWQKHYPKCAGRLQSPIDIAGSTIKFRSIAPMHLRAANAQQSCGVTIKNDGSSVVVKLVSPNLVIEGGSLPGIFVVTNLHFHWSMSDLHGSEHLMGGKAYPFEMHIVTYNRKYRNMQEAYGNSDGIHVIAVMYEISKYRNQGLSFCTSKLDNVIEPESETDGGTIDASLLLPAEGSPFYRYRGSLTTPPCTENVIWSVFTNPELISIDQLHKFRNLKLGTKVQGHLGSNNRPIQPMEDRMIFTNNPTFSQ